MRAFSIFILLSLTLMFTGCGPAPVRQYDSENNAFAFGNITLPDDAGVINGVMLYELGEIYAPPFKSPPRSHTYTNGNFMFENLKPGQYFIAGFISGRDQYFFNYSGLSKEEIYEKVAINVKPNALTYIGSYKVTGIDRNFIKSDTFDIEQVADPSEKEILDHLHKATEGTGWDQKIAQRLDEL